ncbi:MAG TPA: hypothetical protein DGH68_04355, partial [Bacteroidetes bacterium]|nr:hypothetical protein [Bacteroidota bacterium]
MDGNTTLRIELVSLLKRKRAGSYYHIRDALFVVVSSFITLLFLLSPRDLIGSSSLLPEPAYLPLLALFSDSTETSKGVIPPKGIAPLDPEGKGGSAPEKFPATPDSSRKDTTGLGRKGLPDTSYVVCYDSTARLKHFTYVRKDQPHVGFFPDRLYPLFAPARPATYQRQAVLDSSGKEFRFSETVMGENVKLPLPLSFHEYLAVRRKSDLRKLFAEEARKPKAFQEKNDLGELLSSITKITIPVPANPLFSIFGKNEINVNISGAVDIKAGFRSTKSDQTQVSRLDQTRNEPDFQQEVQVNVNGMIGDKLSILADWNTQRTFEYENQLKIKYTGYDDEIVQSVEAGNVSLNTPSTFIGSSAALFGVKARFQTGPLTLTALASQKKGQIKEVSVSGGAQEVQFDIRPFNYSTNHFFVDTLYQSTLPGATAAIYEEYYQNEPARVHEDLQIIEEEVWVQRSGSIPDPTEREGIAYITLDPRPVQGGYSDSLRNAAPNSGSIEKASFVKLERSQYELTGDGYIGVISLNANVQDQQVVAVAYRRGSGAQFGEFSRDDTSRTRRLVLKMLKPQNLQTVGPGYPVAWKQMLKNVYQIPGIGRNLKKEGFILDIYRTIPGRENENSIPPSERLLRVFGFDNYTTDGTAVQNGDNGFDFRPGKTISQARAEIIFPTLRPFDDGIKKYYRDNQKPLPDTSYYYPEIYDTTKTFSQQSNHDHYLIKGKASGEVTSKYPLGFNIVEGSVQVYLDGRLLTPNIDYTVDYIVGEVVIRNERALVPGANLQIKFEQNDLFQLASKTLLGARGDLAISKNTNFGFTVMNLNQQTLSEKVRLGEEPNKNTILGVDGQTKLDLPFLTNAIDALPLLETRDASEIRITGEAAYMIPDPNTKKSTIPSDNGEGIAYIDDFEGARRTIPLGISYSQWYQPSPPKDGLADSTLGFQDTTKMFSKGKTVWFNVLPTNVRLTDVYPRKQPGNSANDQLTVLDLQYYPLNRGMYNYSPRIDSTLTVSKNWGGIMKPISIAGTNLITENVNFIEFWVLLDLYKNRVPIPKIRIDLGSISEDVIPNERLNSEDVIGGRTANGTLQADEDVGLDMLDDAAEIARYGSQWG